MFKKLHILFWLLLFLFLLSNFRSIGQNEWLSSSDNVIIQKQSLNLINKYNLLLNNIIDVVQSGHVQEFYESGNSNQIFQDGSVYVSNEINPIGQTNIAVEISRYLNYWYTYANNSQPNGNSNLLVYHENMYVSPVFVENNVAFAKVYFQKRTLYPEGTITHNEFAVVRSIPTENGWFSYISGIDLLNEKVEISDNRIIKELNSFDEDLGILTERITKDSTTIVYKNFLQTITPSYSRINYLNRFTSILNFDDNSYTFNYKKNKMHLFRDSIKFENSDFSVKIYKSKFNIFSVNTDFSLSSTNENNINVILPTCLNLSRNGELTTITSDSYFSFKTSNVLERVDLTGFSKYLRFTSTDASTVTVAYDDFIMEFLLTDELVKLTHQDYTKPKIILTSDYMLSGMELISTSETSLLNNFYIDKSEVTVGQFSQFIDETKYVTEIEKCGWSYILPDGFKPNKKYKPSQLSGISSFLKLEKSYQVNWTCDEFGKRLHMDTQDTIRPVIHISYFDALQYSKWAGKQIPTRAELEYASKDIINGNSLSNHVIFIETSGGVLCKTCQKLENNFGVYDILGNVYEWCEDWACKNSSVEQCQLKSVFGGCWFSHPEELQKNEEKEVASVGSSLIGFRCVVRSSE